MIPRVLCGVKRMVVPFTPKEIQENMIQRKERGVGKTKNLVWDMISLKHL